MWLYRVNKMAGQLLRPYWRLHLDFTAGTIPLSGPLIVAANHQSFLDPWFLGFVFPRPVRYLMTHHWYYRSPLWTRAFSALGTCPVASGSPRDTVSAVLRLLGEDQVVGIFPEGRIAADGRLQRFQPGLSWVAALSGAPVLPVGIHGAFNALPRHRRVPRPARVTIAVGETCVFPGSPHATRPPRGIAQRFMEQVQSQVAHLSGESVPAPRRRPGEDLRDRLHHTRLAEAEPSAPARPAGP